jgi:hypothetical protein
VSLDAALARIVTLDERSQRIEGKVDRILAILEQAGDQWVTPSQWARANGCSVDTASRKIAAGEIETKELRRTPLLDRGGKPLVDKQGAPRFRRTLRVRLARPVSDIAIRQIAAEMVRAS